MRLTTFYEEALAPQKMDLYFVGLILNCRDRGLQLVGPLPADIQNYTRYAAAPASESEGGLAFVRFLGTAEAKGIFVSAGIE